MSFFNTTNLKGQDLFTAQEKADNQDKSVLEYCKELKLFSAYKLWRIRNNIKPTTTFQELQSKEPISSVRRALNTLECDGFIRKVTQNGKVTRVKGLYSTETLYELV